MVRNNNSGTGRKILRAVADGFAFAVTSVCCFFALRNSEQTVLHYGRWDFLFACLFLSASLMIFRFGCGVYSRPWFRTDARALVRLLLSDLAGGAVGAVVCRVAGIYRGIALFPVLIFADLALIVLIRLIELFRNARSV